MGVNPEYKSGAGAPKAVRFCEHCRSGSYPATTLAPNRSSITAPLDSVSVVESGDMLHGQQLVFHINSAQARDLSSEMERILHLRR